MRITNYNDTDIYRGVFTYSSNNSTSVRGPYSTVGAAKGVLTRDYKRHVAEGRGNTHVEKLIAVVPEDGTVHDAELRWVNINDL